MVPKRTTEPTTEHNPIAKRKVDLLEKQIRIRLSEIRKIIAVMKLGSSKKLREKARTQLRAIDDMVGKFP